jgi:hypothetical protein
MWSDTKFAAEERCCFRAERCPLSPKRDKGEKAMIARFDHRPITIAVALATVVSVLLLVVALFVTGGLAAPSSLPSGTLDQIPTHSSIVQTMIL